MAEQPLLIGVVGGPCGLLRGTAPSAIAPSKAGSGREPGAQRGCRGGSGGYSTAAKQCVRDRCDPGVKRLVSLLFLLGLAAAAPVKYALSKDGLRLTATAEDRTVTLVDFANRLPRPMFADDHPDGLASDVSMWDLTVRDFDADGVQDALVAFSMGGNCCPPTYRFVTLMPRNVVRISNSFEGWAEPAIETYRGRPVAMVTTDGVLQRFRLVNGCAKVVDEQILAELTALVELRIETFDARRPSVSFDLGGDG